jgi:hypothetical protein
VAGKEEEIKWARKQTWKKNMLTDKWNELAAIKLTSAIYCVSGVWNRGTEGKPGIPLKFETREQRKERGIMGE